jgi:hypothetical protein
MRKLWQPIDNAPLIIFRIFFGFLLAAESFGAILTGWLRKILVEPTFTFSHIGFEWLQPLPGYGMYAYYVLMGIMGISVMLGYKYRWTLGIFTILWTGIYLMQKEAYNNHYYLLVLVCIIMLLQPANKYASIDAKNNPAIKSLTMPQWCSWIMIFQMIIVYFYATVAKFYPGWLEGTFAKNLFTPMTGFPIIGPVFKEHWFHLFITYSGILFDGLIIPALLWRKTRTIALIASLLFHLFNSATLKIGIFPYFALSFAVFFYAPETIRRLFFKNKPVVEEPADPFQINKKITVFFILFFTFQLLMPLRHWLIKGDVLWTEEGHRLSWRMMLRQRSGYVTFNIIDRKTKEQWSHLFDDEVTYKQRGLLTSKPDAMWQYAQRLKKEYAQKGKDVSIYIDAYVSVNNGPQRQLLDPKVDFAEAKWDYFWHNDWILLYDEKGNLIEKKD